jgi:uncharacterized FAD-dependent dehydrogenase
MEVTKMQLYDFLKLYDDANNESTIVRIYIIDKDETIITRICNIENDILYYAVNGFTVTNDNILLISVYTVC